MNERDPEMMRSETMLDRAMDALDRREDWPPRKLSLLEEARQMADFATAEVRRALVEELERWHAFAWHGNAMRQAHAIDARLRECAAHLAVPGKAWDTRREPSELERVLKDLDELAESLDHGCHITTPVYDAARLLRALAADFAKHAQCNQACRSYVRCDCGLDAARERWKL